MGNRLRLAAIVGLVCLGPFLFNIPATSRGPFTVTAVLKYRSAPQEIVDDLLGKDTFELPIVDMAGVSASIN